MSDHIKLTERTVQFGDTSIKILSVYLNDVLFMVANPFAKALKYVNYTNAVAKFVSKNNQMMYRELKKTLSLRNSLHPKTKFINERGLYELINGSKMPKAKEFHLWVTTDMLPKLRDSFANFRSWGIENADMINLLPHYHLHGSIYIATNKLLMEKSIFKIGMTTNLRRRLQGLNVSSPCDFYYVFTYDSKDYIKLENHLHNVFIEKKIKRELFVLNSNDLLNVFYICKTFSPNSLT